MRRFWHWLTLESTLRRIVYVAVIAGAFVMASNQVTLTHVGTKLTHVADVNRSNGELIRECVTPYSPTETPEQVMVLARPSKQWPNGRCYERSSDRVRAAIEELVRRLAPPQTTPP